MRDRKAMLLELIQNPKQAGQITLELAGYGWECEKHLAEVAKVHVLAVLKQFDQGMLSAAEVEAWALSLEGRKDVSFEFGAEGVVEEAIFCLANPSIYWPIDEGTHLRIVSLFERRKARRD
jgi:hypothetical protein